MAETLRERQKQVARELILQAAADEIVERGLETLSLQAVADRAGVSKRTLYNYFETRETLLAELGRWSDELTLAMGGYIQPAGLDTLPDMVPAVWRTWAAQGTIHEAVLMIGAASNESGISNGRRRRRSAIAEAIREVRPDLDGERCGDIAALLHAIASAPVFRRLTAEDGLTLDAAGSLASWCLTALREALIAGDDPYTANGTDEPKEST